MASKRLCHFRFECGCETGVGIQTDCEIRLQPIEANWNYWSQRWSVSQEELCVCIPCHDLTSVFMIPNTVFLLWKTQEVLDLLFHESEKRNRTVWE